MLDTWCSLATLARSTAVIWLVLAGLLGDLQPTSAADGKFVNLSTRALVETGEEVMIGGFIIEEGSKQVLIQALGPELVDEGIANALADPVLTVIQTSEGEPPRTELDPPIELMVNDNWEDSQGQLISDLWGGNPNLSAGSYSSAVVLPLGPGGYTAKVEGKDGTTGVAIVEVYGIDSPGSGSGVTRLRNEGSPSKPAWSPDGTRIAFSGHSSFSENSDIYVMNVDGSGVINLTNNSDRLERNPAWSPDGTKIAFSIRTSQSIGPDPYEIYVMNADGSDQTRLTNQSVLDGALAWSPDGTRIAFSSYSSFGVNSDIYVVNVDGSGVTNLTNNPNLVGRDPAWDPDGTRIAFSGVNSDIYLMNTDGSDVTNLTNSSNLREGDPAWSPDGTRIAFSGHSPVGSYSDVYVMNVDGSGLTNLTNHPAVDTDPAWSPDGTRIAFSSDRDDPRSLSVYVLRVQQATSAADGEFVNLSTRALVETGEEVMIGGLIIEDGTRQVLIQAVGPELANAGIANALADPVLTVIQTSEGEPPRIELDPPIELMVNDNWEDSQGQLVSDLWGGNPNLTAGSYSSAVVLPLGPGGYTAKVEGKDGTAGVAIVEVYGIDSPDTMERKALAALYNAMDGANWRSSYNWGTAAPLDLWYGVQVDENGRVTRLNLRDNQLSGPIPAELGRLANLTTLNLSNNQLIGPIPAGLGNLANLEVLRLDSNTLSGPIPAELGQLSNLEFLSIEDNQLSGPIPAELGQLTNLRELYLGLNQLSGAIPEELVNLPLIIFSYSITNLCLPANAELEVWLNGISSHGGTGKYCADLEALAALYNATNGENWKTQTNWLSVAPLGKWSGVTVDNNGRVIELDLSDNQLSGQIPPRLSNLADLRALKLGQNQLSGPIPAELGLLASLNELSLANNQLDGQIPAELGDLAFMDVLDLRFNRITGSIPPQLGNLAGLQLLQLSENRLSGSIPPELGNLTRLQSLELNTNDLSGSIPPLLGYLPNLEKLDLSENRLNSLIPPQLGNLANLEELRLGSNDLSGSIPSQLGNLSNLKVLDLHLNELSGPIPPGLGNLLKLESLQLSSNQLSGPMPPELGNLFNLETLWLADNQLTGPIPPQLGLLLKLEVLDLGSNQLSGPIPTELTTLTLNEFDIGDTDLCVPVNEILQAWLNVIGIYQGTGNICPTDDQGAEGAN